MRGWSPGEGASCHLSLHPKSLTQQGRAGESTAWLWGAAGAAAGWEGALARAGAVEVPGCEPPPQENLLPGGARLTPAVGEGEHLTALQGRVVGGGYLRLHPQFLQ